MGAAHWVAQCIMWKTREMVVSTRLPAVKQTDRRTRTLFDAVLFGLALLFLLLLHALGALVVVSFQRSTRGGLQAF